MQTHVVLVLALLLVAASCGPFGASLPQDSPAAGAAALAHVAAVTTPTPVPPTATAPGLVATPLPVEVQPVTPAVPSWTPSSEATATRVPAVATAAAAASAMVASAATAAVATATASAPAVVTIRELAFAPASLTVRSGQTVVWRNLDGVVHTVSFQGGIIESGRLEPGFSFASAMHQPGTWVYHCSTYPTMTGTIVVTE